jgi:hypothetical protein
MPDGRKTPRMHAFRDAGHRHQLQRNTSSRDASHRFLESMSEADL